KNPWRGQEVHYPKSDTAPNGVLFRYDYGSLFQFAGHLWQGRVDWSAEKASGAKFELGRWDGENFQVKCVFPRQTFTNTPNYTEVQPFGLLAHDGAKTQIVNTETCSVQLLTSVPMPVTLDSLN